jgi:hypothetical protein
VGLAVAGGDVPQVLDRRLPGGARLVVLDRGPLKLAERGDVLAGGNFGGDPFDPVGDFPCRGG